MSESKRAIEETLASVAEKIKNAYESIKVYQNAMDDCEDPEAVELYRKHIAEKESELWLLERKRDRYKDMSEYEYEEDDSGHPIDREVETLDASEEGHKGLEDFFGDVEEDDTEKKIEP